MGNFGRAISWALSNGLFAVALWFGQVDGVRGAWNLSVFYIWFGFVLSFCALSKTLQQSARKKGPPVPMLLNGIFDAAVTIFLAWHGHWVLATVWVIHALLLATLFMKDDK